MKYEDLLEALRGYDEITLMELLEVSSEDLIERFQDRISEKIEQIREQVQEEGDPSSQGTEDE